MSIHNKRQKKCPRILLQVHKKTEKNKTKKTPRVKKEKSFQ